MLNQLLLPRSAGLSLPLLPKPVSWALLCWNWDVSLCLNHPRAPQFAIVQPSPCCLFQPLSPLTLLRAAACCLLEPQALVAAGQLLTPALETSSLCYSCWFYAGLRCI
ncbi:hypothetical protein U1Q18_034545 [Sarracenia purpurea var. burkii]